MARTESMSIQVHPDDEQNQIDLMQKFYWSLLSSQEIKTVDSGLERRGDKIYSVTRSERYIKLVFQRDLETPNIDKLKELENEYFSMSYPKKPGLLAPIPVTVLGSVILAMILESTVGSFLAWAIIIIGFALGFYWLYTNINKRKQISELCVNNTRRKEQIIAECGNL